VGVVALLTVVVALALVGKTGAQYDADAHQLSAKGAAAADPRTPSADVARVKAERAARADATQKLTLALKSLGYRGEARALQKLLDGAVGAPDYGADGSVTLSLSISTEGLTLKASK